MQHFCFSEIHGVNLLVIGVNLLVYLKTWVVIVIDVLRRNVTKLRRIIRSTCSISGFNITEQFGNE